MSNEVFVAFWAGMAGGVVIGFMLAAIAIAIQNNIERNNDNGRDQKNN